MGKKPKRANLKPQGRCIFCGGFGLTKEHIFADWLKDYIPREMLSHTTRRADVDPFLKENIALEKRTGDIHSRRIRCVCKTCNTGWMSRLQTAAKPFLVPMLTGQEITLHRRGQTTLAAWVSVMVMVAEYVNPDKVAAPESDRVFVMRRQKPPNHWRIWISTHANKTMPLYTHNVLDFAEKGTKVVPGTPAGGQNTHTTTICLGQHLLIHVMASVPAKSIIRRWKLPAALRDGFREVWPVSSALVTWPPSRLRLNDAGLDLLANEFLNKALRLLREGHEKANSGGRSL